MKYAAIWLKTLCKKLIKCLGIPGHEKSDELHKKSSLFLYTLNPFLDII